MNFFKNWWYWIPQNFQYAEQFFGQLISWYNEHANHNNQETDHVQNTSSQCNSQNGPNKQQYKTLQKPRRRERQTEPGLVAFYVTRSGNGAGLSG